MNAPNGKDKAAAAATKMVIVDGSNVAHSSEGDVAVLDNIRIVTEKLEEEGFEPLVLVDAALRHQIDDLHRYEQLVEQGRIRQAPAGTDADYFILSFARELGADIVSNDRFRDSSETFREEKERVIRYMILNGEVVLERRHRRRKN